ncbi:hypothetical protein TIFTF001_039872 [Ficus carica]|uniref:Protein FAR1-RELATED SEQUENCE n=1 Tax=Ficus carica TaxID=3494 RepID=A0AA87YX37_FICCA|nr:hypothetical protein TIFTF001_039872 [Ficus carica]
MFPVKRRRGRVNRSWEKTDCKASLHVKRRDDGRWIISSFIKEHNHEIFPDQAYYFRGHRNLELGSSDTDALHAIRARTKKMYMQRKTTLKEFMEQYRSIIREKTEEEVKADFETWNKQPGLKSPSPFGKQMAAIYTHAIFKKFQVEVLGVVACHPRKEAENGEIKTFRVQDFEENQNFIVEWNETTSDVSCLCRSFEFNGFICRHVMIVLQMSGVHSIPSQCILKRWTKDAKSRQTFGEGSDVIESRVQRYNDICQRAFKLSDEGSLSHESYDIAFSALEEALRKCESINNSIQTAIQPSSPSSHGRRCFEEGNQSSRIGNENKRNGASKKGQVHSEPEIVAIGIQESWQQMGQINSRAPTLDGYFGSQEAVQGMSQLNPMAPNRDDYYSNQHGVQGLGQLNSLAPIQEAHYVTQQRMHVMGQSHFRPQTTPGCFNVHDSLQDVVVVVTIQDPASLY